MSHEEQHPSDPSSPQLYSSPPSPSPSTATTTTSPMTAPPYDLHSLTPVQRFAIRTPRWRYDAVAGAIAGITSGIVTCPLDVIKTKLQAQGGFRHLDKGRHAGHPKLYNGLLGTGKVIWREEGVRGMYRGLGPIILGYLPTWAVYFTVYARSKGFFAQYSENQHVVNIYSSVVAGATSTVVTNPIWVIKTRLMSQSVSSQHHSLFPKPGNTPTSRPPSQAPWHYRSTIDAARKMYTTEGVLSFYSGLSPALLGLSHVAVHIPAYEFLKTKFTGQGLGVARDGGEQAPTHWLGVLAASILSKILASSATYPHEVIRTRLQTQRRPMAGEQFLQGMGVAPGGPGGGGGGGGESEKKAPKRAELKYRGVIRTFRTILHEEGWQAFYAGMGTNMMRAVPAATVTFLTYEYVMGTLSKARKEAEDELGGRVGEEGLAAR